MKQFFKNRKRTETRCKENQKYIGGSEIVHYSAVKNEKEKLWENNKGEIMNYFCRNYSIKSVNKKRQ